VVITRRTMAVWCAPWCALALAAALITGCDSAGPGAVASGAKSPGRTVAPTTVTPTTVTPTGKTPPSVASSPGQAGQPIWLRSLQMTSATTGWAFYYSQNPNSAPATSPVLLARTVNGGRTWTDVTPAAALPVLATFSPAQVLDAVDGEHAYLAVSEAPAAQSSGGQATTIDFFTTADGGRTWTESPPLRAQNAVSELSFANPADGFLMAGGDGGSMGQDPVSLYRTADGGKHWSLAAATPPPAGGTASAGWGPGQIPRFCDKYGLAFPTATTGWISSDCLAGLANTLLVTRDGGTDWSDQPMPLPATICTGNSCDAIGPEFTGGVGFLTVVPGLGTAALLETRDLGQTWQQLTLPADAGLDPQVTFFTPEQGVLVAAQSQGSFGNTFYITADGGQTWTAVPQGTQFTTQDAVDIDFTSTRIGFAWATGEESDPVPPTTIYETTNSGQTWRMFTPRLSTRG
jgi:photosystem II stability/assembly factor-like uncharacterized protein